MKWAITGLVALFFAFLGLQYWAAQNEVVTQLEPTTRHFSPAIEAATEEQLIQAPVAAESQFSRAPTVSSTTDEETLTAHEQRVLAAVEKFKDLRDRELLIALSNDPLAQDLIADILLVMLEQGYLEANDTFATRRGFEGFSPLFFALMASENMDAEMLNRFLDLGSRMESNDEWRRVMARQSDLELLEMWYESTGLGPEHHQQLFNEALQAGNMAFVDFILETKGGKFDQLTFSGATAERIKEGVIGNKSLTDESLRDFYERSKPEQRAMLQRNIIALHEQRLKQIELLLLHAELSDEERLQIERTQATLLADIQRINDFFAAQGG
ncbi:hypothetical protein [Pseudidiomarina salilacus]|uniref:hypothetical protein n=1 Tax=Pseudidiomarina salilacus TaxID=3384452 RepID=UPI0039856A8D